MSLIGSRPLRFDQQDDYSHDLNLYMKVRPGLTGLWQVSGRNPTTWADRAVFDAYYVRNWSIWLDIYILANMPLVILRGEGSPEDGQEQAACFARVPATAKIPSSSVVFRGIMQGIPEW